MQITEQYKELQKQLHAKGNYGNSGSKHADRILGLCQKLNTRDVLDYGCGQQTLGKNLPFPIQVYDPCITGLDSPPRPADIVVCSDVMEHVEPECVADVIADLGRLTKKVIFLDINTGLAQKILADGRNAHISMHPVAWWIRQFSEHFDLHSLQSYGNGFVMVATPWPKEPA